MAIALKKVTEEQIISSQTTQPNLQATWPKPLSVEPDMFHEMVTKIAYFKAEQRGFEPGYELQDWLEAEQELLSNLALLS